MKNLHAVEAMHIFLKDKDASRYDIVFRYLDMDDDKYESEEYDDPYNAVFRYNHLKRVAPDTEGLSLFIWDAEEQEYHLFLGEKPEGLL